MSWITITEVPAPAGQRTKRWEVHKAKGRSDRSSGVLLGRIQWFNHWRKYAFQPCFPTVFEEDCLREIADFIETETGKQKA